MAKKLVVVFTPPEVDAGVKRHFTARRNGTLVNDYDVGSEQLELAVFAIEGDELKVSIGNLELTITAKSGDKKDGGKADIGYIVEEGDGAGWRAKMRKPDPSKPQPTQLPAPAQPGSSQAMAQPVPQPGQHVHSPGSQSPPYPNQPSPANPNAPSVPGEGAGVASHNPNYDPRFGNLQSPPSDRAPQQGQVSVDGQPQNLGPAVTAVPQPAGVPIPITNQPTINPMVSAPQPVVNPSRSGTNKGG